MKSPLVKFCLWAIITACLLSAPAAAQSSPQLPTDLGLLPIQKALAEFGYGVRFTAQLDAQTKSAIEEYQRRSGLKATGILNEETAAQILKDQAAIQMPGSYGQSFSFYLGQFAFSAAGIWIPRGTDSMQIKGDVENSRIFCAPYPEQGFPLGFCEDISVRVDPIEGFRPSTQSYLKLAVTRWDRALIEAHGKHPMHSNISYIYRFDLKNKNAAKVLIRQGAVPPFEPVERWDLRDPYDTLWKSKREEAWSARCRIMLLPQDSCSCDR